MQYIASRDAGRNIIVTRCGPAEPSLGPQLSEEWKREAALNPDPKKLFEESLNPVKALDHDSTEVDPPDKKKLAKRIADTLRADTKKGKISTSSSSCKILEDFFTV